MHWLCHSWVAVRTVRKNCQTKGFNVVAISTIDQGNSSRRNFIHSFLASSCFKSSKCRKKMEGERGESIEIHISKKPPEPTPQSACTQLCLAQFSQNMAEVLLGCHEDVLKSHCCSLSSSRTRRRFSAVRSIMY